ncbi:hypothetical protein BGZ97_008064 [Linnemannia gamsii]|uniref:C2H2-type domain-containing protein n=1 Tax=Linnemannia gamsii TaxID=64522 RepID=A0A9P6RAY9_9FUNG|nr:hypothetical protein BGZ97_008064 [Linnemannia gamsii]
MAEERTPAEPHHESEVDEHTLLLHLQQTIANNTLQHDSNNDDNNKNSSNDIKALTKALTTPIDQIEAEERAAAAAVAAVAASVAATAAVVDHSIIAKTDISTPAFDVNNVYNQVLSSIASQTQTTTTEGKRTAQEAFEQTQAAQALQLIALSLGSVTASTTATTTELVATTSHVDSTVAHHTDDGAGAVPGTTDPLLSITEAISNFQRQTEQHTKLDDDTTAIAQAVLLATQANAHKINQDAIEGASQAGASSSSAEGGTNQGLTFEVDKATGKTQIKWVPDSRDDASAIQQALHTLIANSGILGVPNGGLLAPPLGQFPVQGSQFGTAKEPVKTEVAAMAPPPVPHVHKKRRTGGSSTQNTAASIPEGATAYPCTFENCDKVFARLYNLKSHSRTHTNERPFICSHCQLSFARNHDLKRHVKIHGGDKPFKCGGCGKSFSRLDALGRHKYNSKNRANCVDSVVPILE